MEMFMISEAGWWDGVLSPLRDLVAVAPYEEWEPFASSHSLDFPERGSATLGKMFVSLNVLFAEPYPASASQLHGRAVSKLPGCSQSLTFEHSPISPGRRGRGRGRCIPNQGRKGHTNKSSEEQKNSTGGPQTLSA